MSLRSIRFAITQKMDCGAFFVIAHLHDRYHELNERGIIFGAKAAV